MKVYLVGFMGAGKSTVGRRLAEVLGWRFVDLDEAIAARAERSIREIFEKQGEVEFRRLESSALRNLSTVESLVVATGGGAVTSEENRTWMRQQGVIVWLDVPFATLIARLRQQESKIRPLFADEAQARSLYESRLPFYRNSDMRIEAAVSQTPERLAESIARRLRQRRCAT